MQAGIAGANNQFELLGNASERLGGNIEGVAQQLAELELQARSNPAFKQAQKAMVSKTMQEMKNIKSAEKDVNKMNPLYKKKKAGTQVRMLPLLGCRSVR